MYTISGTRKYSVKQTGNRFFYWSPLCGRWFPIAKSKVVFED